MSGYCVYCGKPMIEYSIARFSAETGHQLTAVRCPDQCSHNIHRCEDAEGKFWHIFVGYRGKCRDCGKKLYHEDYS